MNISLNEKRSWLSSTFKIKTLIQLVIRKSQLLCPDETYHWKSAKNITHRDGTLEVFLHSEGWWGCASS